LFAENYMKKLRIIPLIALLGSFYIERADANPIIPKEPMSFSSAQSSAFFEAILSCMQYIDTITGNLAKSVSYNHIKITHNKDQVSHALTTTRSIIRGFLQSIASESDPTIQIQLVHALIPLCEGLIDYLEQALTKNFKDIKPFDPAKVLSQKRSLQPLTPEALAKSITDTFKRVQLLDVKAQTSGLTWYNRYARSIDKHIVSRWNKYHISPISKAIGLTTLVLGYYAWKFGGSINPTITDNTKSLIDDKSSTVDNTVKKSLFNSSLTTLHNHLASWFGEPIYKNITTGEILKVGETSRYNEPMTLHQPQAATMKEYGLLPFFDLIANDILLNHSPLAAIAAGSLWVTYTTAWKTDIAPYFYRKRAEWWNYLRGGAYLQTKLPGISELDPKVTFDDMIGLDEVKEEFQRLLEYLENPEKFANAKACPETGWLLTGPTRTGKSFSFECFCGEIVKMFAKKGIDSTFKFLKIDITTIQEMGIEQILLIAKMNAPMVLFIDEIDLLGLQRVGDNKLLHQFLTALQSTKTDDPSKVVIVMAATNRPESLDQALRQNGRFGKEIRFEYPSFKYRKQHIVKELRSMALDPSHFDIDTLVAKTDKKSYEDLLAIIRTATTRAWSLGMPLTQSLLEESIDRELNKIIMMDRKELSANEKQILAVHFAGKGLAMMLLDTYAQLDKVTTKARMTELIEMNAWYVMHAEADKAAQEKIVHGAMFTKHTHDNINLKTKVQILNEVKVLLAGFAAEEILLGSSGYQCHGDSMHAAYNIIDKFVFKGISPKQLSSEDKAKLQSKAYSLFKQCKQDIKALLQKNRELLARISDELVKHSILTDKDIAKIIQTYQKEQETIKNNGTTPNTEEAIESNDATVDNNTI